MPPTLALILGCICTVLFLRFDSPKARRTVSAALWIPTLWLLIVSSRPISQWFVVQDTNFTGMADLSPAEVYGEGSPLDRNVFLLLIIAGAFTLFRRRVKLIELARQNPWLLLFAAYGCISVLWSDYSLVAFKRWVKLGGNVVMGAVVATESNATEAFRTVLARCTYILVPLSIVLIKYYPEFGRRFNPHTGFMQLTGVNSQKNELGTFCMLAALFVVWSLTMKRTRGTPFEERLRLIAHLASGAMVLWLLIQADSATSTVTAAFGVIVLMLINRFRGSRMRLLTPAVVGSLAVLSAFYVSGAAEAFILAIGEDLTLTGRTDLWAELLTAGTNPLLGTGFESFWLGSLATELWQKYWWRPNQAHNGFLDTYLNLGLIGLVLLCGYLAHVYSTNVKRLRSEEGFDLGRFALTFLVLILLHNVTEAGFHGLSLVWVMQIVSSLSYTRETNNAPAREQSPSPVARPTAARRWTRPRTSATASTAFRKLG
jgi:O-antigen ligase